MFHSCPCLHPRFLLILCHATPFPLRPFSLRSFESLFLSGNKRWRGGGDKHDLENILPPRLPSSFFFLCFRFLFRCACDFLFIDFYFCSKKKEEALHQT